MDRLLLIDAYAMIYRAYYAFIKNPRITSTGKNTSAIFGFVITLQDLLKSVEPTHVAVAFDPKGKTFRHEAFEQYKAQRPDTPEDIHAAVPEIKRILEAMNIAVLEVDGFEADDVIGTIAKQSKNRGFETYMATPDKDYGQLVEENIYMYRPRHTGGFERLGTKEVCDKYGINATSQVIDLLGLMGDASDNIPGCQGVGEKTAVKLLQEFGSIENMLNHTDQIKGALRTKIESQVEQIRFSRFLATIRTDVPISFKADDLKVQDINLTQLKQIFTELEFRSLLKKYDTQSASVENKEIIKTEKSEPTLFDDIPHHIPAQTIEVINRVGVPDKPFTSVGLAIEVISQEQPIDLFSQPAEPTINVLMSVDSDVFRSDLNDAVKQILENAEISKIGYDLKTIIKSLKDKNITLCGELFDVSIAHYLIQSEQPHDVASLAETYLKCTCPQTRESYLVASTKLKPILQQEMDKIGVSQLFSDIEMPLVQVLADMELAGVRFDTKVLKSASKQLSAKMNELEVQIQQLAGKNFNVNSPKQVGEVLFDDLQLDPKAKKTKGGQYVTSEERLQELQERHPIINMILEYRAYKKLLSTYIDALPEMVNPKTGKIHTTYNQTITSTGRLSSSNPNLQNLPVRTENGKEIRRAVIPDNNCTFLSADYSQIELRLMAHFSGDEHLLRAFEHGQDIHAATASKIYGCSIEQVTRDMRRKAKTANFGIIYGISSFGLAQQLQSSRTEAKQLIDDYFRSFPKIVEFIEQAKQTAREKGYAQTLLGRRRYLPDISSRNPTVRSFAERNAVNAPIQGTAADIIKLAMVRIYRRLIALDPALSDCMIMQVHDELNFNVPNQYLQQVKDIVVNEMQNVIQLRVPLIADCNVGTNWLEAH